MTCFPLLPISSVLLFPFAVCVLASLLFQSGSDFPVLSFQVSPALKQQAVATAEGRHAKFRRFHGRRTVSLSVLLLVGAGLFTRTLKNMKSSIKLPNRSLAHILNQIHG